MEKIERIRNERKELEIVDKEIHEKMRLEAVALEKVSLCGVVRGK